MNTQREQDHYGDGNHQQFNPPPPPLPPQHQNSVNPEMTRGPVYPGQQTHYSNSNNNNNPFTDSKVALSQRSSRESSTIGGPGMTDSGPRYGRTEVLRGYSDSVHSGSSDSGHYAMDHIQRDHRSPSEGGVLMGNHPPYSDNPYNRYSATWDNSVEQPFNPDEIADDGDDGLEPIHPTRGRSALGNRSRSNQNLPIPIETGITTAGLASNSGPHDLYASGTAAEQRGFERSQMLAEEAAARKRKRGIFIALVIIVILAVITAGTVAGVLLSRKDAGQRGSSASQDDANLLTAKSSEIQALMSNPDLHRVFPGMDYTPFNAQYPACLTNPPSQNNITRDVAVLSRLTNVIRLYGTDCNQTDMILESMKLLEITDMKIWLAVWLDNNQTTNDRGMDAMWDILKRKKQDSFAGVILGNEVLFRKDMTLGELTTVVQGVRNNFSTLGYNLPIAVADLGDNWTAGLAAVVDVVMSNVHPFFAGITPEKATDWTLNFWKTHDVILTAGNSSKENIISEVGWPSEGGNDCGGSKCADDTSGAVASIPNMNTFMDKFICPSLKSGTNYFW